MKYHSEKLLNRDPRKNHFRINPGPDGVELQIKKKTGKSIAENGNYFVFSSLSKWILNLGVVPLFLSAFLREEPDFFVLLARRVFVTLVLETINHIPFLSNYKSVHDRKSKYLPDRAYLVKSFLCVALILFYLPIEVAEAAGETLIMAIGEQKEIHLPKEAKFSLGNSDIITYKFFPRKNSILLKGKKLGFSDLVLWKNGKILVRHHLYVLSKVNHLRSLYLANILKAMGLHLELEGPVIFAKGTISSLAHFNFIKKLEKKYPEHLFFQCELSPGLRKELIQLVYDSLRKEGIQDLSCLSQHLSLTCHYDQTWPPQPKLLQSLSSRYSVEFFSRPHSKWPQNYRAKIKLVQMEKLDGEDLHLGLQRLSGSYQQLFYEGVKGIVLRNEFLLNQSKIQLSILAEPETLLRPEIPAQLEMGSQIPTHSRKEGVHWAFAGLRVKLLLNQKGPFLQLAYETEFTRPDAGQNITGNKESSSLVIKVGKPYQLFEIGYRTQGSEVSAFPWIASVPLLGALFRSQSEQSTFKKIYGIIVLEEFNE